MKSDHRFGYRQAGAVAAPPARESTPVDLKRERFIGIDLGAETLKLVELIREHGDLRPGRRIVLEHGKEPGPPLLKILAEWDWPTVSGAAVSGRLSRQVHLPRVPTPQAQSKGFRHLHPRDPATLVSIGSHGFSVLELRSSNREVYRENSRCSQGTGNFLRQLIERFALSVEAASELCAEVDKAAPLSGRCPVILKTDMTHLANKGEDKARILAGLFDAVCENVFVLIKPGISPKEVFLTGGVSRSRRVRRVFAEKLAGHGMTLVSLAAEEALYFEALGSALIAAEHPTPPPSLEDLLASPAKTRLDRLPALADSLSRVRRLAAEPRPVPGLEPRDLLLGFDIGSTGSKVVALDSQTRATVWEGYRQTEGAPVHAAQALLQLYLDGPAGHGRVLAFGVTGSGREIVGSLMTTCYGKDAVFILNEIAAHAAGASHFDPRVDTIFEIGGQDAKYIRLAGGRVVDCAMNEACSAGTGSFIEEQGRKFSGIQNVVQLSQAALSAPGGVSLGQHCSVFMAEIIDEAVAAGVERPAIIAGLYDSIIQNYLHRVKGSRSVGQVIFCQGMPFASDALAAAVARQTGSQVIIPPNPGTVGALGIALLARQELDLAQSQPLEARLFLEARVEQKDTFACKSTVGCGGAGNRCRIDSLRTVVDGQQQRFTWGGGCALHDKGTRKRKLPDRAPDPFRQREELLQTLLAAKPDRPNHPRIALTDEFMLKGLFPFFTTYLYELGFDLAVITGGGQADLKHGIQEANVPFCAPMQLFHGLVNRLTALKADRVFIPMIRHTPRTADEPTAATCPIAQASPDILRLDLGAKLGPRILSPVIDFGARNLESPEFKSGCEKLAADLGLTNGDWLDAFAKASAAQTTFEQRCLELGRQALDFCSSQDIPPVVVLGRPYTIYSTVLNSNVPAILREQGAIGIPVDCYPTDPGVEIFPDVYYGYGQRILRAAHQIRRRPGVYSLFCSNYSCGPDSFSLHFYSYIMEGKPFAIIETDGHSGDAGTKTRVEAFLHCVEEDRQLAAAAAPAPHDFHDKQITPQTLAGVRLAGCRILIPTMGPGSETMAACLRGLGAAAECLPFPDQEALRLGRRYTSGKECLPMSVTLGNLLKRVQQDETGRERFVFLMPHTHGPCRFGNYNLLNQIIFERLGIQDRITLWSPADSGYFVGTPAGFSILLFSGFMASDMLFQGLLDARPVETRKGAAGEIYRRHYKDLLRLIETSAKGNLSVGACLWQVASGRLFGIAKLLRQAAREWAAVRRDESRPTVLMVGEIYVRCDPFANDFVIEKLEEQGLKVRFAPLTEWIEYSDHWTFKLEASPAVSRRVERFVIRRIQSLCYNLMARSLGWDDRTRVEQSIQAAEPYVREELLGEAVLTVGCCAHEWHKGAIEGAVSVGPLECMPNKVAEAQFFHLAEREGLLTLTLPMNGDPLDPEVLHSFAFEVKRRHRERLEHASGATPVSSEKGKQEPAPSATAKDANAGEIVIKE